MMIRQLSDDLRSHLRSGVAITSVTQCTEELVMNALDAGATCIAIRVDLPCFKVQVVDNGQGMTMDQLNQVGERYSTSKCHELEDLNNLQYFGFRGEAIASMRDTAAIVEISSRTKQCHQTYCRMFQKGSGVPVTQSAVQRPSVGTTVTVHDLFYSLPVRRKAVNEALELEKIRYRVEGIALINPSVSFTLRNDVTAHILLQTRKSSSTLTSFTHLFGQGKAKSLREVTVEKEDFDVEGYIGKEGHSNKNLQFVFVNNRLVLKTKIHKVLNHLLKRSLVLKKRGSNTEYNPNKSPGESQTSSPGRQGEKYAVFVLNVKCPLDVYDITFDPAKTLVEFKHWSVLTNAIDEMVMSFLRKENLISVSDFASLSSVTPGTEFNSQNNKKECVESSHPQDEEDDGCEEDVTVEKDYTGNISTHSTRNCLFSRTARRPYDHGDLTDKDEGENMLEVGEENITSICESVTERRESPTIGTPVTHVDDSCHVTEEIYFPERSKPPPPNCGQSSAYKSDTSEDVSTVSESHESTTNISPLPIQTSTLDCALTETGCNSVHSVTGEENQQCFTAVRAPTNSAAPPGESEDPFPADESEDPFPSSLRGALSTNNNGLLVSRQKYASTEQGSEKIPFICLPDSPPPTRTLGVHKLQNLRLISSKPSLYSTSQHKLDVTSMGPQSHKSAAQKISERLGLTGKKIISEKLQKFKNKSVSSRLNISKTSSAVSDNQAHMHDDKLAVPNSTLNQQSGFMDEKSGSNGDSILCESVLPEMSHVETNKLSSKTDDEESNLSKQTNTVSVSSKSSGLDSDVQTSSGGDLEIGRGRKPIVPTIADIDTLISKSETAPRKRFNPFALSTASKLSKLVRKCDSSDQDTSLTKQREFLTSDTLLEVPRSLSKAKDNKMVETCDGLSVQSCDRHHEWRDKHHVDDHTDDMPTHNRELLTFQQSGETNVHESIRHSANNLQKHETHQTPDSTDLPMNKKVLPFVVYSDMDCMKDVDRITDMDVSETESIDSLPHIDCFSPVMADLEAEPVTPDMSTHPKVQPSHGFSPDVRLLCEEDCQSGGFSPRIVDEVMSSTSSPSGPITTDKEKEGKFPSDVTNNIEKNGDSCSSARPAFGLTETPKYPKETSCENEDELAVCDSVTSSTNTCSGRFDCEEENKMHVASVRSHLHTTSEADEDTSYITCAQHPPTCEDTSNMCSTEDTDSFPLRILLSGDSGEVGVAVNRPDIFRSENQKSSSNSQSDVVDSSAGLILDGNGKDGNEINEALAKEFDSDMAEENFVYSREVTVRKTCTSTETINLTRTDCKHGDTGVSSSQPMDDEHREPQSSMDSMTEETSCSTVGTEGRHDGTAVNTWSKMKDPKTGVKIYVNNATGNTMFEDQWRECKYSESENSQPVLSSKSEDKTSSGPLCSADKEKLHQLLNCHLVAGTVDDQIKWRQPSCSAISQSQSEQSTIEDLFSSWENPVCHIPPQSCVNAEVSPVGRAAVQSLQTLYPTRFSKPMLQTVQVLGQVDNKFIACVLNTSEKNTSQAPDLIVLFDQHAAHERVRLEQLTEDIYVDGEDITGCSIKQSHVSPPKTLTFTHEEVRLIKSFREEFKRIGVVFTVSGSSRDSLNIHSIPACLVEREANEVKRGRDSVVMDIAQVLIKEHLEMLRVTGGARNRLPQTIHKVLCSQACHGAVKFGDSLSLSQCQELLESLAQCDLPFQCAHGRPSIMPLLGLEQLQSKLPPQRVKRPNLWKISKNLLIHQ